jgi:peroxiredoxin Q/BCP
MALKEGDKIPSFALPDQNGNNFAIESLISKKPVVLYFYPKDETVGCIRQACAFRDYYTDFQDAGAEAIGISSDMVESHVNFSAQYKLPFVLLSDKDKKVRNQFGVPSDMLGLIPGRVTYIIDKQGKIKYIFNSQIQIVKHITEALRILKNLN